MDVYLSFLEVYLQFLQDWQNHLPSITFAASVLVAIVSHLFIKEHAKFGKNGESNAIACADVRVHRDHIIFGGPAGMSFGLPYFWLMGILDSWGLLKTVWFIDLKEYWAGFVYVQFATSLIQLVIFVLYEGTRSKGYIRAFKAHLKGCGWVSALSPVGWILYVLQQFLPKDAKILTWAPRDVETVFIYLFSLFGPMFLLTGGNSSISVFIMSPLLLICIFATVHSSLFNLKPVLVVPTIWWIDEDHEEDEDSSR